MCVVQIKNISYMYKKGVPLSLDNVSFSIEKGAFHAFVGENGAGKSTTIKSIIGQITNYDGVIEINGKDPKIDISARKGISYIPDKAIFPNNLSTFKYLYNFGLLVRDDKIQLKKEIEYLLDEYGISDKSNSNPNSLSAGQKKKVCLIKCIIEKSDFIILDEPAANLDPTTRMLFFQKLKELCNQGVTIFISSHILEEIKLYATAATYIKGGKILWSGNVSKNQLIDNYNRYYLNDSKKGDKYE